MPNSKTFDQFEEVSTPGDVDSRIIGYKTVAGVKTEIRVPYSAIVDDIKTQVFAEINYVPPDITAFLANGSSPRIVETGSTISSVALSWTLAGSAPTSQSIDQSVGSITPGTTTANVTGSFTSNRTWTLTVSANDPQGNVRTDTAAVSLTFMQKRYWGVSASTSLDSSGILALSSEFSSSKTKTVTYNATGGRYPYFCYPATLGALTAVTVGGIAFSDYTTSVVSFTNSSGYTENYNVVRFNTLQNGSNIQVSWS